MRTPRPVRIHINGPQLRANTKALKEDSGADLPPVISVKRGNYTLRAWRVGVLDTDGNEIVSVVYDPVKGLKCGARAWVEVADPTLTTVLYDKDGGEIKRLYDERYSDGFSHPPTEGPHGSRG